MCSWDKKKKNTNSMAANQFWVAASLQRDWTERRESNKYIEATYYILNDHPNHISLCLPSLVIVLVYYKKNNYRIHCMYAKQQSEAFCPKPLRVGWVLYILQYGRPQWIWTHWTDSICALSYPMSCTQYAYLYFIYTHTHTHHTAYVLFHFNSWM